METPATAKTTSTQLFGVLYITLKGMVDTMVPNSGPWFLLGRSVSYIIKLAPILLCALPSGPAVFHPKSTYASIYAWLPDRQGVPAGLIIYSKVLVSTKQYNTLKAHRLLPTAPTTTDLQQPKIPNIVF
ncbi:hypothetical protein DSO57_1033793 [Entomophthora muscae]|uniref:Uncharacterized protein n=1 Tax=Entomophthora muscae TaxID=34485 RepID=A0ACC2ULB6_9FUNG|nr:hypothetical protein DSO57_1033793 [Entomophthora muscae]